MFDREKFLTDISERGCSLAEGALAPGFVARAKSELEAAIDAEARYHGGIDYSDYGMVLLCSLYGGVFWDLFEQRSVMQPIDTVLGETCIVYAYTSSSMPPESANYSRRIHVDSPRLVPQYMTNLGVTIALDDFTEENGATWYLPGSHTRLEPPSDCEFYRDGRRLLMAAGSVFFFNARLWHAGGQNRTQHWRHALTLNMCRPYMKQRVDIPRAMAGMDLSSASTTVLQKLGFLAQVPANYDEYYAPPHLRKFRQPNE